MGGCFSLCKVEDYPIIDTKLPLLQFQDGFNQVIRNLEKYNSQGISDPREDWLSGVSNPGEFYRPPDIRFFNLKFKELDKLLTEIENMLTHWPVAHVGSN